MTSILRLLTLLKLAAILAITVGGGSIGYAIAKSDKSGHIFGLGNPIALIIGGLLLFTGLLTMTIVNARKNRDPLQAQ